MKFGFYLPTCAEGTFYPRGFVDLGWIAETVQQVEEAGFYEISASDYVSTGRRTRDETQTPPLYLEPLSVLTWLAGQTSTIRLLPNVIVLPLREIVILAKELSTIDYLSGGRMICGLGLGANRDEFEAVRPRLRGAERGKMLDEALEALRILFTERSASYSGKYLEFADVELYPKPVQQPMPVFLTGDSVDASRRAAKHADGWITFVPGLAKLSTLRETIEAEAKAAGRPSPAIVPMIGVSIADTDEQALANWGESRFCAHLGRISGATPADLATRNLVGSAATIAATIDEYAKFGVDHMTLVFAGNTTADLTRQVTAFIRDVVPTQAPAG